MAFIEKVKKNDYEDGSEVIKGMSEFMDKANDDKPVVRYETRRSKKTDRDFDCLVIYYHGYEKIVFLQNAEFYIFSDLKGR